LANLLEVRGLTKRFGAVVVADGIDLDLATGTCLGVIGPNGAGKSSFFHMLAGALRADAGRIMLEGRDISGVALHRRARLGIARAFQIPQPFAKLTVRQNVLVPATFGGGLSGAAARKAAEEALARTGLIARADLPAGRLTLLDRKRLELAKALAARPKLLLLDEIAGGLTEPEVRQLVALVQTLKPDLAIIWIEHIAHALLATADRIMVLHFGVKLMEGQPQAVMASREVREIYMGIAVDEAA
jgi:branched-chain amino acid transport system ATP-binding protein